MAKVAVILTVTLHVVVFNSTYLCKHSHMNQDIVAHIANLLDGPYTVGYSHTVLQLHLWRGFLVWIF